MTCWPKPEFAAAHAAGIHRAGSCFLSVVLLVCAAELSTIGCVCVLPLQERLSYLLGSWFKPAPRVPVQCFCYPHLYGTTNLGLSEEQFCIRVVLLYSMVPSILCL
jgi:hypothetical protein